MAISKQLKETKENLNKKLENATDIEEIYKYLDALKTIEEIEKTIVDKKKSTEDIQNINYQRRSDFKKFSLGIIAPFITSLALILTIILQTQQTNKNYIFQAQSKEDDQWYSLLTKISAPGEKNDATIPVLLKRFYHSDRYRNNSVEITASVYLLHVNSTEQFNDIFDDFVRTLDETNYQNLVKLSRALFNEYNSITGAINSDSLQLKSFRADTIKNFYLISSYKNKLSTDLSLRTSVEDQLSICGKGIYTFLKSKNIAEPNLTDAYFYNVDLQNINLKDAIIDNTVFDNVIIDNADLSVKSFKYSNWPLIPWWKAKNIDNQLLSYLVKYWYFNPKSKYYPLSIVDSQKYQMWVTKAKNISN